jgi:hypothetical protein
MVIGSGWAARKRSTALKGVGDCGEVTGAMVRSRDEVPGSQPVPPTKDDGEFHFGCSMLRRTHLYLKGNSRPAMRCSLGFSVRTREDIERCLAADGPHQCWHITPVKRPAP